MEKDNQFFTTYKDTKNWLLAMNIWGYTINNDLTVDVNANVNIQNKNLEYIPVQFGIVKGDFLCSHNKITSLESCPKNIWGDFFCHNNKITSLKGSPKSVGGSFFCKNNKITTLENFSTHIGGNLYCYNNLITDFNNLEFKIQGNIIFTSIDNMNYLDSYKDEDGDGDISINFNDFKKIQTLKNLNEKLNDDLPINTNITKKMKV